MNHIVIDFEFTPVTSNFVDRNILQYEIIEIGAVKLNDSYQLIDSFSSYVQPIYSNISKKCSMLTGITNKNLTNAPEYIESVDKLIAWIGNEPFEIYEWSDSDKIQFVAECNAKECADSYHLLYDKEWIDLQKDFSVKTRQKSATNLRKALRMLNLFFEGQEHSACDDAYNTARILQILNDKESVQEAIPSNAPMTFSSEKATFTIGSLFSDIINRLYEVAI